MIDAIVCLTPLHVLIGRAIARRDSICFQRGFYIQQQQQDERSAHYAGMLSTFCKEVEIVSGPTIPSGQKHFALARARLELANQTAGKTKGMHLLMPSSIDHLLYVFATAAAPQTLSTYDDGWLNIQPDSLLTTAHTGLLRKAFGYLTHCRYWPEKVRERSTQHYSIYKAKNFAATVTHVPLLVEDATASAAVPKSQSHYSFFVAPAPEASPQVKAICADHIRHHEIQWLFPHPRDTHPAYPCEVIRSPMIVEDYVMDLLSADPALAVSLYGVESSALINLAGVPRVTTYSVLQPSPSNMPTWTLMQQLGVVMTHPARPY